MQAWNPYIWDQLSPRHWGGLTEHSCWTKHVPWWLVLACYFSQKISARFSRPSYHFSTAKILVCDRNREREFLCRTGSITSMHRSSRGLNPRPLDLKDNLYSVKHPAAIYEIKPLAVREHAVLSQPVGQQFYPVLDSLPSTWAILSKQESAAVRSLFLPLVISSQRYRMTAGKLFLTFVFFPAAFLPPSYPQKRKKPQQSPDHSYSSSSCKKSTFRFTAHPFFHNLGLVQGFGHGD